MNRIFVDHERLAIAGDFYNVVNNEPMNNSTFVAIFDQEISQSVVIYLVDISSNSCTVTNFTGLTYSKSSNCLSLDKVSILKYKNEQ